MRKSMILLASTLLTSCVASGRSNDTDLANDLMSGDQGLATADLTVISDLLAAADLRPMMPDLLPPGPDLSGTGPLCGNGGTSGMVQVNGGAFAMGATDLSGYEQPVSNETVASLWLDATEVTVAAYAACVTAGACTAPDGQVNSHACNWQVAGREQHPINCVDWHQAAAYCAWQCRRLPSEIEWEYAARGSRGSLYPWGDQLPNAANQPQSDLCWNQTTGTCPTGQYTATLLGQPQPSGLYDLAGNVWEWTASVFPCPYPLSAADPACGSPSSSTSRSVRGGSWYYGIASGVRAAHRNFYGPSYRGDNLGFRCAQ